MTNDDNLISRLAEIEADDPRTTDQKIGAIITGRNPRASKATPRKPTALRGELNAAERALRSRAKKLCLDYADQMVLNLVDLAMHHESGSVRVDASKQILQHAIGRPSTVHVGADGAQIVPNFTIVFGDQPVIQQIETDFECMDDGNDEED